MRFLLLAACCSLLLSSCANASLNKLYRQHKKQEGATKVKVPAFIMRIGGTAALQMLPKEARKAGRYFRRRLGSVRFLQAPKREGFDWDNLHEGLRKSGVEDLVFVRSEDTRVQVAMRERKGKIRDFILLIESDGELIYIHLRSRFKMEDIQKLIQLIQQTEQGKKLPLPPMA